MVKRAVFLTGVHDFVGAVRLENVNLVCNRARLLSRVAEHSGGSELVFDEAKSVWFAGELLDAGAAERRNGLALIREIAAANPDDVTKTMIALLSDLHPSVAGELPQISAHSLDPRSVVITTSILRRAEDALVQWKQAHHPAFGDLLEWTQDASPLVRWTSLAGAQLVVGQTRRYLCRDVMHQVLGCRQPFVVTRLLRPLWRRHRQEMSRVAAASVAKLDMQAREWLILAAVDALGKRRQVPRFVRQRQRVVYVSPPRDPWPQFGRALARLANRDHTLWPLLERCNEWLAQDRREEFGEAKPFTRL